jgi:hypothetical protein
MEDTDFVMTNTQTFSYMGEYLSLNSAVAIYPEGTLNRCPEVDGILLPLKSNKAFELAEDGKGVIRPVAIVWVPKEMELENKVVIAFLKPIYTVGLKSNDIERIWLSTMNHAIESINRALDEMAQAKYDGKLSLCINDSEMHMAQL